MPRKGQTKKKTTTKKPKKVEEKIDTAKKAILDAVNEASDEAPITMESIKEPPKPVLTQESVDQEVKYILNQLGAAQSKFQQLGNSNKSRALRDTIKLLRLKYKVWR